MRRALDFLAQLLPPTYGLRSDSLERLGTLLGELDDEVTAGVGAGSALQRVRYVDPNTTLSLANQKGTVTQPWATRQQAMDYIAAQPGGAVDWTVVLAGNESTACTVPAGRNITFSSSEGTRWTMGATTWTIAGSLSTLWIRDLIFQQVTILEGASPVTAVLLVENAGGSAGISRAAGGAATVYGIFTGGAETNGSPSSATCYLTGNYAVDAGTGQVGYLVARSTNFLGTIAAGSLRAQGCAFSSNWTIYGPAAELLESVMLAPIAMNFNTSGTLRLDSVSTKALLQSESSTNGNRVYDTERLHIFKAKGAVTRGHPASKRTATGAGKEVEEMGVGFQAVAAFVGFFVTDASDGQYVEVAVDGLAALFSSLDVNPTVPDSAEYYVCEGFTAPILQSAIPALKAYRRCGTVYSSDTLLLDKGEAATSAP